jgi:PAS domain S-box-containing protein
VEIDGEPCILGMIHDITERKEIEKALAEERTLLRTLIDALPDYIFAKDIEGRFTLSNMAHARAGNTSGAERHPSAYIGKSAADFFPAEIAARFDADDQALLQSGEPLYNIERVTLDASGEKIYVATTKVPLRDTEGNVIGLVGISRDITAFKKAQETLKQQEDFLRQVIDASPNLIWVKDWDGRYVLSNKKHAEAVGVTVDEVIGSTDLDIQFDPVEAEHFVRDDREVMTTLKPKYIPVEAQTNRKNGEMIWLQTTKVPLVAPDGVTPWVLGVAVDVTQQHNAEEALQASEERYRMVTELISDYAFSMRITPDGELADEWVTADSFERFTGYQPDETGTRFTLYHPNDVDKVKAQLADVLAGKSVSQEVRIIRKDGEMRWMLLRRQPVWDAKEQRVTRYYGVSQDITERKRAQEALQQAHDELDARVTLRTAELSLANQLLTQEIEERQQAQEALAGERNLLRTLIDNLPQFIYIKDRETRFIVTNRAHAQSLLGRDAADEMIGKTDADFYPPDMIPQFISDDRSVLDTGIPVVDREELSLDENHHPIWLLTNKLPLRNSRGEVTGLVGVGLNITERKRAEEALQQSHDELERRVQERTEDLLVVNEEVKRFAYIVSHDLRAPLVNIKGFASELRSSVEAVKDTIMPYVANLDERQRREVTQSLESDVPEALGFINASVERMNYLINAILQLSRMGQRRLQMDEINVDEMVRAMIKSLGHQIAEHKASVTVGDLPTLTADRTAMEQIFGNILSNAVLYLSPERDGEIEISGERWQRETVYHIRDNGVGIAEDDRAKVFELFRRAGRPTVPGEGIGLAYVQALVRRHQGRIWFESQLGVGTTFSFAIPHQLTEDGAQTMAVGAAAHG